MLTHSKDRIWFALDSEVYLWNVTRPTSQASIFSEAHTADVTSVSLDLHGERIAIGRDCDENNVKVKYGLFRVVIHIRHLIELNLSYDIILEDL